MSTDAIQRSTGNLAISGSGSVDSGLSGGATHSPFPTVLPRLPDTGTGGLLNQAEREPGERSPQGGFGPFLPRHRENVLYETLSDGTGLLVDPKAMVIYALSLTGGAIWQACDGRQHLPSLVERLASHYDVGVSTFRQQAEEFLHALDLFGLFEQRP